VIVRILSIAFAAWLGGGAIAYGAAHARFGLTPSIWWLVASVGVAVLVRRRVAALLALVLLLPWMPMRVPPAFLVWTGHAAGWIALIVAAAIAAPVLTRRMAVDPRRAPWIALGTAAVLFLAAAWRVSPQLPAGDEPHYLVIAQSLLTDHDLQIENNHRRGDYHAYFPGELRPDYLRRGTNDQIYSIHAPGLPAVVAPVFAVAGYPGVMVFLALVAAAAAALAWTTAFGITGNAEAAWFGWAVVALSEPFFVQTFMVYPDAPAGAIVMLAIATALAGSQATRRRLALTGVALALLPWLHTRDVLLAAPLAAVIVARQFRPADTLAIRSALARAAALLAAPAVSAVAWFAFFYAIYGTPDPRAPYGGAPQMALASLPRGSAGLLFDQQFGLLTNAPVYLFAALGFIPLIKRHTRVALELVVSLAPYAIAVAAFQMWWGGYTTPARFLVPVLLPLAIPAAAWFDAIRRPTSRALALAALALSGAVTLTVVAVDRGALLLNFRDGASRLIAWLSPIVDLTAAVPSLFRSEPRQVLQQALVWLGVAAVAMALAHLPVVLRLRRDAQTLALGAAVLLLTMAAATLVWQMNDARPVTPDGGALGYLRAYDGDAPQFAVSLSPLRRIRRVDVPPRLALVDAPPHHDAPLADVRHVPAATYAIELTLSHPANGRLTAALDRALGPAWTVDVTGAAGVWRREFVVPVASPALIVDADPALRAAIDRVTVRATVVPGSRHRIADGEADHAARYGHTLMFLLGGRAFMEPNGTWVQGGASADFAVLGDDGRPVELLVRTPPIANRVGIEGDGWRQDLTLAAGASAVVALKSPRIRVTVANGARPADFEPGSPDVRFLGAWIEPR